MELVKKLLIGIRRINYYKFINTFAFTAIYNLYFIYRITKHMYKYIYIFVYLFLYITDDWRLKNNFFLPTKTNLIDKLNLKIL